MREEQPTGCRMREAALAGVVVDALEPSLSPVRGTAAFA
jgi:hypothetical protein